MTGTKIQEHKGIAPTTLVISDFNLTAVNETSMTDRGRFDFG